MTESTDSYPKRPTTDLVLGEMAGPMPLGYEALDHQFQDSVQLRNAVYEDMYKELQERASKGPVPTAEELAMGIFREGLEPQVRDALYALRAKGYDTVSSGFDGRGCEEQALVINTLLPAEVTERLLSQGYTVEENERIHLIVFKPDDPLSLSSMKRQWDRLASTLPDLGQPAPPALLPSAKRFRDAVNSNTLGEYVESWKYRPVFPNIVHGEDYPAVW